MTNSTTRIIFLLNPQHQCFERYHFSHKTLSQKRWGLMMICHYTNYLTSIYKFYFSLIYIKVEKYKIQHKRLIKNNLWKKKKKAKVLSVTIKLLSDRCKTFEANAEEACTIPLTYESMTLFLFSNYTREWILNSWPSYLHILVREKIVI